MSLRLRFSYGQIAPWRQCHERGFIADVGPDRVVLDCPVELTMDTEDATARFMVASPAKRRHLGKPRYSAVLHLLARLGGRSPIPGGACHR